MISSSDISQAVHVLRRGGIVAFPTETSYGLAVDPTNERAVARLFRLKGRAAGKSVPIIAASTAMAARYAHLSSIERRLARRFWPGPLTIVLSLKKGTGFASGVAHKNGTVALRVSSHPIARALSRRLKKPITATSANLAGGPPAFRVSDIPAGIDYVLASGALRKRRPSTIVQVVRGEIRVLRAGAVGKGVSLDRRGYTSIV